MPNEAKKTGKATNGNGYDDAINNDDDVESEEADSRLTEKKESFNGPYVVYLSPDNDSRHRLKSLRKRLRDKLFRA